MSGILSPYLKYLKKHKPIDDAFQSFCNLAFFFF